MMNWVSPTQEEAAAADFMSPLIDVELTVKGLPHVGPGEVRKLCRRYRLVDGHSVCSLEMDIVRPAIQELMSRGDDEGSGSVPPFELLYSAEYVLDEGLYDQLMKVVVAPPMQQMAMGKRLSVPAPRFGRPFPITVHVKAQPGSTCTTAAPSQQMAPAKSTTGGVATLSASALNRMSSADLKPDTTGPSPSAQRDTNVVQPLTDAHTSRGVKVARIDEITAGLFRGHFTAQGILIHVKVANGVLEATLFQPDPHRAGAGSRISVACMDTGLVRRLADVFTEGRVVRLENVTARAKSESERRVQTNGHSCRLFVDMHSQVVDLGVQSGQLGPDVVSRERPGLGNQGGVLATSGVVGFMRSSGSSAPTPSAGPARPQAQRHAMPVRLDQGTVPLNAQLLQAAAGTSSRGGSSYAVSTIAAAAPPPSGASSVMGASSAILPKRTLFTPSSASSRSGGAVTSAGSVSGVSSGAVSLLPGERRDVPVISRADVERRDGVLQRAQAQQRVPRASATKECIFCHVNLADPDSVAALVKRINHETPHHTRDGKSSVTWTGESVVEMFKDHRPGVGKLAGRLHCKTILRDPVTLKGYRCHPRCAHICTLYQNEGDLEEVCSSRGKCSNCLRTEALVDCYEPTCKRAYCIICALFSENLVNFGRFDPINPVPACPGHTQVIMDGSMKAKRSRGEGGGGAQDDDGTIASRTMFDSSKASAWANDPDDSDGDDGGA